MKTGRCAKIVLGEAGQRSTLQRTRPRRKQPKDDLLKESITSLLGFGIALIGLVLGVGVAVCWHVEYAQRISFPLTIDDKQHASALPMPSGQVLAVGSASAPIGSALSGNGPSGGTLQVQLEGYPGTRFGWIEGHVRTRQEPRAAKSSTVLIEVELPASWRLPSGEEIRLSPGMRATASVILRTRLLQSLFGGLRSSIPWA